MAKLFKTLSLEDRWKASVHHNGPVKPMPVNQGHIDLKTQGPIRDVLIPLLRSMPEPIQKLSDILKTTISKASQATQTIKPLNTKPLTTFAIPFVNTKFRSAISLADRLKQPNFGTTTHLAQYFLADQYTDYIKITPFGIFNHTSDVVVQPITFIPQHGGNNPTLINFNSLLAQGVSFSNGLYFSNTNVNIPSFDSLLLQGTVLSNNTYLSVTNITLTTGADTNIINPNIVPSTVLSSTAVGYTQGIVLDSLGQLISAIVPNSVPTVQSVLFTQGVLLTPTNTITSYVNTILPGITPSQGGEDPNPVISTPLQGGVTPTPITFQVDSQGQTPILDVLFYEAQRALAFFAPRIIHGSANISTRWSPDINQGVLALPNSPTFGIDQRGGLGITSEIGFALGKEGDEQNILDYTKNVFDEAVPRQDGRAKPKPTGNNYSTLTYDQITARAKEKADGTTLADFRSGLTSLKGGNGKAVVVSAGALGIIATDGSVNGRGVAPKSTADDFITLRVTSKRGGYVDFRAFITSFSDSVNVSWNDINYVGRQDTLKAYKGSTRGGSIAFKVAALCEEDMATNYEKLNTLVQYAGVGKSAGTAGSDLYIRGPLCSITVGRWFTDTPVVFNSIKFDVQMAEYSWDIDKKVPHLVDVSLDFVVLGDNSGNALGIADDYFNYKG
jgi:hypothetical protein